MLSLEEYREVRDKYITEQHMSTDSVYNYFTEKQISILQKYYEVLSKYLYNSMKGNLKIEVSKEKKEKLSVLKGEGAWEFAGMIDVRKKGAAVCELGHPLRYVYKAKNMNNGEILLFGSRCVSDFFLLEDKDIKVLEKIKDYMFVELKTIASIKSQNLYNEHYAYDCKEFGTLLNVMGIGVLDKIKGLGAIKNIVNDFMVNGIPFPNSLLKQIFVFREDIHKLLNSSENLNIDINGLEKLKGSDINIISEMFLSSEQDVIDGVKKGTMVENVSDFYNFRNIEDLNSAIKKWLKLSDKIQNAQNYFSKMNITTPWIDIYKKMVSLGFHRDVPNLYYAVEILMLFDSRIQIEYTYFVPRMYSYKGYSLSKSCYSNFESLLDYMMTRDFFMYIREIQDIFDKEMENDKKEQKRIEEMMDYLKDNLMKDKYTCIKSIGGVQDIVLKKQKTYEDMSEKQQQYIEGIYKSMKALDEKEKKTEDSDKTSVEDNIVKEINNRYSLVEKVEILAKIQRLQEEAPDKLTEKLKNIINTVMSTKYVSDRQILRINQAFDKFILGKDIDDKVFNEPLNKSQSTNRKWNLIERPDVKEKIVKIKGLSSYFDIPQGVRNILENILKYNSASDSQITTVERTYRRYFGS